MTAEAPQPPGRTPGEQTFEIYLRSQGLTDFEHEKPFPGKSKHPDYSLTHNGLELLFEVKDIESRPQPDGFFGSFDPHAPIREKIDQARKKFREFKKYPCSLVLFASGFALVDHWKVMFGAMHGDMGFQQLVDTKTGLPVPGTQRETFLHGGRMTRPHWRHAQNTTINAVIAMRWIRIGEARFVRYLSQFHGPTDVFAHLEDVVGFDKQECAPGAIVYENLDATHPLTRDLFTGPFDLRYAWAEDGSLTKPHVGDIVRELDDYEEARQVAQQEFLDELKRERP